MVWEDGLAVATRHPGDLIWQLQGFGRLGVYEVFQDLEGSMALHRFAYRASGSHQTFRLRQYLA